MKFKNGRKTEYYIFKLMDRHWENWDGPYSKKVADKKLSDIYGDLQHFAVMAVETTLVRRGVIRYRHS